MKNDTDTTLWSFLWNHECLFFVLAPCPRRSPSFFIISGKLSDDRLIICDTSESVWNRVLGQWACILHNYFSVYQQIHKTSLNCFYLLVYVFCKWYVPGQVPSPQRDIGAKTNANVPLHLSRIMERKESKFVLEEMYALLRMNYPTVYVQGKIQGKVLWSRHVAFNCRLAQRF